MVLSHARNNTSIQFAYYAPQAHSVAVVGNFNDWQSWGMERFEHGIWLLETPPVGQRQVCYQFVVDGHPTLDPSNLRRDEQQQCSVLDTSGSHGSLYHSSFFSEALQENKRYSVYLPPSYGLSQKSFPVLYLMGGLLDYELDWPNKGRIAEVADLLIQTDRMQEMILVMPDKSGCWTESGQEHLFYRYITQDLMGHIENSFRIDASRGRAIEGLSIGAMWAMRIAFHNPFSFTSVSSLSCPLSDELYELASKQAQTIRESGLKIRLNSGDQEGELVPLNFRFQELLGGLGIHSECYVGQGPHDWPLWKNEIVNSLKFHSGALRQA